MPLIDTTLRREWNENRERLTAAQHNAGFEGVMARANLDMLPALLAILEREHQRGTSPRDFMQAMVGVLSTMTLHTVRANIAQGEHALDIVLSSVNDAVRARLREQKNGKKILLPGLGG